MAHAREARRGPEQSPTFDLGGRRRGARERVLEAMQKHPLKVEYDALATRVLFDAENRAVGVEYLKGRSLYRASPGASREDGELRRV